MFGYLAVIGAVVTDLGFGLPLIVFAPHVAIALGFTEGTVSLSPYRTATSMTIPGGKENATLNLRQSLARLRRRLLIIFSTLLLVSATYGLLPALIPTPASLVSLAIYVAITLVVFAIIVLYLGARE